MKSLRSRSIRIAAVVFAVSAALSLIACSPTPVVAPIIVNTGDIQRATVTVPLDSTLVLNTGSLDVDS